MKVMPYWGPMSHSNIPYDYFGPAVFEGPDYVESDPSYHPGFYPGYPRAQHHGYWQIGQDKLSIAQTDLLTYAATGGVGALIGKSLMHGVLGPLLGAAAGFMLAAKVLEKRASGHA